MPQNAFDATHIVFRECFEAGVMTGFYTSLVEVPVATIENYYHYKRGRKTGEEAIKDAATAIGKRAAMGFAVGFSMTLAVATSTWSKCGSCNCSASVDACRNCIV